MSRTARYLNDRNGSVTSDLSGFGPGRMSPTQFSRLYKKEDVILLEKGPFGAIGSLSDRRNSVADSPPGEPEGAASDVIASDEVMTILGKQQQGYFIPSSMARNDSCKTLPSVVAAAGGGGGGGAAGGVTASDPEGDEGIVEGGGVTVGANGSKDKPAPPQTKAMHLLDAHIIFEPLLSSKSIHLQMYDRQNLQIILNYDFVSRSWLDASAIAELVAEKPWFQHICFGQHRRVHDRHS